MASKYIELKCGRCLNRRAFLSSKQGKFCTEMQKSDEETCPKFKLDKNSTGYEA
jgi:hypothetical protein